MNLEFYAGSKMNQEERVSTVGDTTKKEHRLGVLLVHGIGSQPLGETLVQWGDVLTKTITRATMHEVVANVETAGQDDVHKSSIEAVVRLQSEEKNETWLLSEGW